LTTFLQKYSFRAIENALNREYGVNFLNNEGLNPYGKPTAPDVPPVFEPRYQFPLALIVPLNTCCRLLLLKPFTCGRYEEGPEGTLDELVETADVEDILFSDKILNKNYKYISISLI
jgi:hypothetical protein